VAGKALEYLCLGPPPHQAATLILLHEGLGCVALWRGFPQALAAATGCGVFVYSRQGYGGSDLADMPRPLDYMTREAVDVLPALLGALGVEAHVLVGHSDGATIAALSAGLAPQDGLRGIAVIAPHFFTEPSGLAAIAQARRAFDEGDLEPRLARYHRDAAHSFSGWCESWLHPEFEAWRVDTVLDRIRVPVLPIQGEADPYGTRAQIDVIAARAPQAAAPLYLLGLGHAPHVEAPQDVVPVLSSFVRSVLYSA
jgi:pimeloyl-ACP methyl ester carboxylesterase